MEAPARPHCSAVVVTYRSASQLPSLLPGLVEQVDDVVVVDNASDDDTVRIARQHAPQAQVIRLDENHGFAAGVNAGMARAAGEFVLVCNPDVVLQPGAVESLVAAHQRQPRSILGPVVLTGQGQFQPTRSGLPGVWTFLGEEVLIPERARPGSWPARLWPRWQRYDQPVSGPLLTGACLLIPRAVWEEVGPMDERYFLYWEETDWQLRAHAHGIPTMLVPDARVIHERAGSSGIHDPWRARQFGRSARRFVDTWLTGPRRVGALTLLLLGQAVRVARWSVPVSDPRLRRARRKQHLATIRGLLGGMPPSAEPLETIRSRHLRRVRILEPFGRGGIARYAVDVAMLLAPELHVIVGTTTNGPAPGWNGPVERWFPTGNGNTLAGKAVGALTGLLRAARLPAGGELVWVPVGVRPAYERLLVAGLRRGGALVIATVHNRLTHGGDRGGSNVIHAARQADLVVVHTAELEQWARDHGLPVVRLPFPPPQEQHDVTSQRYDRARLGASDDEILVAMVGNLYRYKGVHQLLEALAEADAPSVRLVLAGQTERGDDLRARCAELGLLNRVTVIPGYVPGQALIDILTAADVVALPYLRIDHTGVGSLAAALGCPAIASDLPTLRELFADRAQYVPPGSVRALADALETLPEALADLRAAAAPTDPAHLSARYRAVIATLAERSLA